MCFQNVHNRLSGCFGFSDLEVSLPDVFGTRCSSPPEAVFRQGHNRNSKKNAPTPDHKETKIPSWRRSANRRLSHELPTFERLHIEVIEFEPLTVRPLRRKPCVPIGLDSTWVVGSNDVDGASLRRQLDR